VIYKREGSGQHGRGNNDISPGIVIIKPGTDQTTITADTLLQVTRLASTVAAKLSDTISEIKNEPVQPVQTQGNNEKETTRPIDASTTIKSPG